MLIIKQGFEKLPWVGQQITCKGCDSVFELTTYDKPRIFKTVTHTGHFIMCPTCTDQRIEIYRTVNE